MNAFQKRLEKQPKLELQVQSGSPAESCLSTGQFAQVLGVTEKTVRLLVQKGNRNGKLRARRRLLGKTWIPVSELFRFRFVEASRYGRSYQLDEFGERQFTLDLEPVQ